MSNDDAGMMISFLRYSIGSSIKTILTLTLLWLFIDKLAFENRLLWRIVTVGIVFILTFFIYHKTGFAR